TRSLYFDSFRIASESPKQVIAETTLTGEPKGRATDSQARITLSKPEFPILHGAAGGGRRARPAGRGARLSTATTTLAGVADVPGVFPRQLPAALSSQLSVSPSVSPDS